MSWVDDAVGTFGREMGFARLRLPEQGAVELAFENRGTLALERAGDDLLLYLQRERQHRGVERLARAMDLCHWRHDRNPAVRAGVKDDRLVLLIRLGHDRGRRGRIRPIFGQKARHRRHRKLRHSPPLPGTSLAVAPERTERGTYCHPGGPPELGFLFLSDADERVCRAVVWPI